MSKSKDPRSHVSPINRGEDSPQPGELIFRTPKGSEIRMGEIFNFGPPDFSVPAGTEDPNGCFKEVLHRTHAMLKPRGFRKTGQSFYRTKGQSTQVANFQRSQWRLSREHPISFTINVRLMLPGLSAPSDTERPKFSHWDFDIRIGRLDPGHDRDIWWDLGNRSDVEAAWRDVEQRITRDVLPVFDSATTIEGLAQIARNHRQYVYVETRKWFSQRGIEV